jgi:hypothetical protein
MGPGRVPSVYSADRHFESASDALIDLRGGAMVEAQHPPEPLVAFDGARCRFGTVRRLDQPIIDPLMIPLPVIVNGVLTSCLSKRPLAEEDHAIEALLLDRSNESFGVGVQVGRAVGQAHDFDTGILQEIPERDGELGIPVEDEEPFLSEGSIDGIGEVPADLYHPRFTWTGRDSSNVDATCCEFDHEEDIERDESTRCPDLDGEEVRGGKYVPVGLEELTPRRPFASLRSGVDSVLSKDVTDRGAPDSMTNVLERPLDPRVSPCAIFPCHADDQFGDDLHDPRSTGGSTLVRPLLGNQSPVPAEDSVGGDESRHLDERPSADCGAAYSKPSPLGVGQSKSLAPELLLKDTVLFPEIVDDCILLARDPSGHRGHQDLPWMNHPCHPAIVAKSSIDRQLLTP